MIPLLKDFTVSESLLIALQLKRNWKAVMSCYLLKERRYFLARVVGLLLSFSFFFLHSQPFKTQGSFCDIKRPSHSYTVSHRILRTIDWENVQCQKVTMNPFMLTNAYSFKFTATWPSLGLWSWLQEDLVHIGFPGLLAIFLQSSSRELYFANSTL